MSADQPRRLGRGLEALWRAPPIERPMALKNQTLGHQMDAAPAVPDAPKTILVAEDEHLLARSLSSDLVELGYTVVGPAPAYIARRNEKWRFHVILRGDDPLAVLGGDPGPPWSVDVDPESLL